MAQVTLIAAQTTAANSADVVVAVGVPVKFSAYSAEPNQSFEHIKFAILEKDPGGNYNPFHDDTVEVHRRLPVFLYMNHRTYTVNKPGTYRVVKDATNKLIGVYTDS